MEQRNLQKSYNASWNAWTTLPNNEHLKTLKEIDISNTSKLEPTND